MPDRFSALVQNLVAAQGRWFAHLVAAEHAAAATELVLIQTLEAEIARAA